MNEAYRGPAWWPPAALLGPGAAPVRRFWLGMTAAAVVLAVIEAKANWSGLPVRLGPFTVGVSVYPPLSIALLLALWIGPVWGMVPAWLATVASALTAGVSPLTAAVFALATPVEVFLMWSSMVTLNIDPDLRRGSDVRRFLAAGLLAASGSSIGVLIWNESRHVDLLEGQRLWQGWLLGDVLQIALVVAPLLRVPGPRVRASFERRIAEPPRREYRYRDSVRWTLLASATLVALAAFGLRMIFRSLGIPPDAVTVSGAPLLPRLQEMGLFVALLLLVVVVTAGVFGASLARLGDREKARALRDPLTGCLNRRAFHEQFPREADRCARLRQGLSLVLVDVDHFKDVNDAHGHAAGDEILSEIADRIRSLVRSQDLVFRWGGEEFLILMPHTDPADAPALAERVRTGVAATGFRLGRAGRFLPVTCSFGTAGVRSFPVDPDALVALADAACYGAKRAGRNRVLTAEKAVPA